ncbi:hypothetical protein DRH27_00960 [Candidatus Falkowbacteria bacterium]|nr:MAG: hypothetical protein DRH27_00960 [Candidatus Falkowbacteria bacterium]
MADEVLDNRFIVCPICQGAGKNNTGFACANCSSAGVGTFSHGRFFYWGPKLGRAMIELEHVRKKIHLIINITFFSIGLAGLLSLGLWIYLASAHSVELGMFAFWREQHILIMIFWIGIIADMFVVYRLSEEERLQHKIKSLSYDERNKKMDIPNNWTELKLSKAKFKIDVAGGYTPLAMEAVEQSYTLASRLDHEYVTTMHLFFSCLANPQVAAVFSRLNINGVKLTEKIRIQIEKIPNSGNKTKLSTELKEVLISAYLQAYNFGQKKVTAKNLIIPALEKDKILSEILYDFGVDKNKIFNVILWFIINEKQVESYRKYKKMARFKPATNMDRAYTSLATPALNQLGYDLTVAAKWGKLEFCVAREEEIKKIWQYFESGETGVILTGEPGVGKKTVIDGIAHLMVKEDVPKFFQDKRLVELDAARLVSGVDPARAEGRMMAVIDEVARAGNIVLFINNIENIIGITSGGEESLDLSEVLAGAIERKLIYCLAAAENKNYSKYIESTSLGSLMGRVEINEPAGNQAIQIVESKIGGLEGKYKIYFSYDAIESAIKLTSKYVHDKYLPQKAIQVLEMVAVNVFKKNGENSMISEDDIAHAISEMTGIPIAKLSEDESKKLLRLEEEMHKRMISQDQAVDMVAASLRRARTELREGKRPIANFLFLGPTGVGKTELAKTVAETYFGKEEYMIRLDMSEYQHPDSIKKMIGDASGAKGYLTEAVRGAPFSLVLLDEIEKAHPDIMNLFLQVMDDGRLTDGEGRTIDFTNCIIIATSNAGALFIQKQIFEGTNINAIKEVLINEHLSKVMRPELINRFDGVIVFEPLSREDVVEIAKLMLNKTRVMLKKKGMDLKAEEDGIRTLAREGFDPKFGARPLRRLLQERVDDKIATKILAGELKRRDTVIINERAEILVEKGVKL